MNEKIHIIKIFDLPGENGNIPEIDCDFLIDLEENSYYIKIKDGTEVSKKNDFSSQIANGNIMSHKEYPPCPFLCAIDDAGEKYTIYNFLYSFTDNVYLQYIAFCFDGILKGGYLKQDLLTQKFDKVETEVEYRTQIERFESTCNSIHSVIEPICMQCKNDEELRKLSGIDEYSQFAKKLKISLDGKKTFAEIKERLWRLSEFVFLCYQDMFFYNTLSVHIGGNSYELKHYLQVNYAKSRKRGLRTKDIRSNAFCKKAFDDTAFMSFLDFRKGSGFIFDVFRTTVYSDTFREDYPLRLSQTLEGLANYLGIADTTNADTFRNAIHLSLYCNDFINYYLPTFNETKEFCGNIAKHRNKFSHVKAKGTYLQGDQNEKYAEILYTTIRVLIIKRLKGEI